MDDYVTKFEKAPAWFYPLEGFLSTYTFATKMDYYGPILYVFNILMFLYEFSL